MSTADLVTYARAITARAWFTLRAVLPRWLLAVLTACLVIPGPLDEMAFIIVGLAYLIIRRDRARTAWRAWLSA